MSIGKRIKDRRTELGWSQRDLAAKMEYSHHSTVGRIESGDVDVSQTRIVQFARVLGVSVAYLMGWEDEIKKDPEGTAEKHVEMLTDMVLMDMYEDFRQLDPAQKKIVADLVHTLAEAKKGAH